MDPRREYELLMTRRQLFGRTASGIGVGALASLLGQEAFAAPGTTPGKVGLHGALPATHFPAKAKRVIYLFQSGAPSHLDLFDWKPQLEAKRGIELPESIRMGQRLTGMTSGQATKPIAPTIFKFAQQGQSGAWLSEILPHTAEVADDLCFVKSLYTEAINHDPAVTYIQTGSQQPGRPSIGSWLSYGLGSENHDLPAYIVLISLASNGANDQPLFGRLWGSGFLPSVHQGVKLRSSGDPVLYLNNPPGIDGASRRQMLDTIAQMNHMAEQDFGDPEINTRIAQYEMAYRMQSSVPDLMDLSKEPASTFELYGPESKKPGTFAANCLLARRLAERGVRFVQLFHRGWDQHGNLPGQIRVQCKDTDQPSAALIKDLKQRGLLEDTLVVWGGEFGRTVYSQGTLTKTDYGRDHHGRCFTRWMAGGGIKPGMTFGETDDFGYNIVKDPVHIHDMNATFLRLLGIDHERLTYRYQGRDYRLTDVHGKVVNEILA
ncbi:MAG TPA: DUF1501 domain-containing protein [Chthonomonadaceae bacterium]|nr:DUF1501 domain-containing protein [Chthonomonadaceae bacterium]